MAVNYGVEGGGGGASGDSPAPSPPPPVTLTTTEAIVPYLPAFHDLLLNPPKVSSDFVLSKQTIKKSIKTNRYLDFIHKLVFSPRIEKNIVYVELESTRPRHSVVILENQNQGLIVKFSEVQEG